MGDYAYDFFKRFVQNEETTIFEHLASYIGGSYIPFSGYTSYFCQYVGLELKDEAGVYLPEDAGFNLVVLDIVKQKYGKTKPDVYFRISKIINTGNKQEIRLKDGKLFVKEGFNIEIEFEACNPFLGEDGYPKVSQTEISISSTEANYVQVVPEQIRVSKYGKPSVSVRFAREGQYEGELIIQPVGNDARIASFRIPFIVELMEE
jgi:hypothetical protein